jgi:hypothetical protein
VVYDPNNPFYVDKAIAKAERRLEEMRMRQEIWRIEQKLKLLDAIRALYEAST